MKKKMLKMLIGLGLLLLISAPPLFGAEEKAEGQSLEQAANDPTASLMGEEQLDRPAAGRQGGQAGETRQTASAVFRLI